MTLLPADWLEVFALETPVLELIARGTALYFGLLVLIRLMPRRTGGELATMDLIFVLLLAESASHALGDYASVGDGIVMIVTLMTWNWVVNIFSYRFPAIERLASAPPMEVIRDGKLLRRNMRREFLTEGELMGRLRMEGLESMNAVKSACVESDGWISVIRRDP
jgi:uncharacterized membrane protein YcaP (DUF421 family)